MLNIMNREKKPEKKPEYKQVGKALTVHLPLKIPQNIQDGLAAYWAWKKRDDRKSQEKTDIFDKLFKDCRRWHLFAGVEAVAGLVIIHTKIGVTVFAGYSKHSDYPYYQATNRESFDEREGKIEPLNERVMKNGQCYKYVRNTK